MYPRAVPIVEDLRGGAPDVDQLAFTLSLPTWQEMRRKSCQISRIRAPASGPLKKKRIPGSLHHHKRRRKKQEIFPQVKFLYSRE